MGTSMPLAEVAVPIENFSLCQAVLHKNLMCFEDVASHLFFLDIQQVTQYP